jgi:hypothetical protein
MFRDVLGRKHVTSRFLGKKSSKKKPCYSKVLGHMVLKFDVNPCLSNKKFGIHIFLPPFNVHSRKLIECKL